MKCQNYSMPETGVKADAVLSAGVRAWREVIFWGLLLPAVSALGSAVPGWQAAGLLAAGGFLFLAVSSLGRLKAAGLNFIMWERISLPIVARCILCGFFAGTGAVLISHVAQQPIIISPFWSKAVLIVLVGPALEEIVFRGYLLTLLLYVTDLAKLPLGGLVSVIASAVVFAAAHVGNPSVTWLQLSCIAATGCLYGWLRMGVGSTAAPLLTHSTFNLVLCLSSWVGV